MSEVCPTCDGEEKVTCSHDDVEFTCTFCDGEGHIPPGEPLHKQKVCHKCDGRGYDCKICNNTGMMTCDDCGGEGAI